MRRRDLVAHDAPVLGEYMRCEVCRRMFRVNSRYERTCSRDCAVILDLRRRNGRWLGDFAVSVLRAAYEATRAPSPWRQGFSLGLSMEHYPEGLHEYRGVREALQDQGGLRHVCFEEEMDPFNEEPYT